MQSWKEGVGGLMGAATGSRAVRRFFLCCDSMALGPPHWRIFSSSFLMVVRSSTMRWEFFSKSGDFVLMAVFKTDEDTRRPRRRKWQQRNQYTEDWRNVRVGAGRGVFACSPRHSSLRAPACGKQGRA